MLRDEVKSKVQTFNFTTPDLFKTIWSSVDRSMNSAASEVAFFPDSIPEYIPSFILVYYMYQFLKKSK